MPPKRKHIQLDEESKVDDCDTNNNIKTTTTAAIPDKSNDNNVTSTTTTTTQSNSSSSTSSSSYDDDLYVTWYWKKSDTEWEEFVESQDIEKFYVQDPKSIVFLQITTTLFIKFSDNIYHSGDPKTTKTLKRSEHVAIWSWEKARGDFYAFDIATSKKIEAAHRKKLSKISIDTERFINLSTFEQVRFDDESKTRRVLRSYIDVTPLIAPAWYYDNNGVWELFKETSEIEGKFQHFLKNGKNIAITTAAGDKIRFSTMVKDIAAGTTSNAVSVKVKRDNGPVQALKKSISKMTDDEKKQLIAQLLQQQQQQQQQTNQPVKKQKTDGQLYLPGEEDIIEGDKPMKYILKPMRHFDNSIADLHFRTAESQFYRLLDSGNSYKVTKVEYIVNPKLVKKFQKKKEEFEALKYDCNPVLGFHGTASKNIVSICANNFSVPGNNGVKHATDSGWYGLGIYFSEFPEYSIGYISDCSKLLLCKVLLGNSYKCSGLITGQPCKTGYTSHLSPDEKELVIFHPDQILPCYVVHYSDDSGDSDDDSVGSGNTYFTAHAQKSSNALAGIKVCLSGTLATTHSNIHSLINNHGGSTSSSVVGGVTHVICTQDDYVNKSGKVMTAEGSNLPVVREKWLYDSIVLGKRDCLTYQFTYKQSTKKQEIKAVPLDDDGSSLASSSSTTTITPPKPMCKYGASCFRKNAQHFMEFSHPFIID